MRPLSPLVAVAILCLAGPASGAKERAGGYGKVAVTTGSGYPDFFGLSLAWGKIDVFEWDTGAFWTAMSGFTAYTRLGFPWVPGDSARGWRLAIVPAVGLRYRYFKGPCMHLFGCDSGGSSTCTYDELNLLGANAVLNLEPTYMFNKHQGLVIRISGGGNFRFAGRDEKVSETCDDDGNSYDREENGVARPELRVAIGMVF